MGRGQGGVVTVGGGLVLEGDDVGGVEHEWCESKDNG